MISELERKILAQYKKDKKLSILKELAEFKKINPHDFELLKLKIMTIRYKDNKSKGRELLYRYHSLQKKQNFDPENKYLLFCFREFNIKQIHNIFDFYKPLGLLKNKNSHQIPALLFAWNALLDNHHFDYRHLTPEYKLIMRVFDTVKSLDEHVLQMADEALKINNLEHNNSALTVIFNSMRHTGSHLTLHFLFPDIWRTHTKNVEQYINQKLQQAKEQNLNISEAREHFSTAKNYVEFYIQNHEYHNTKSAYINQKNPVIELCKNIKTFQIVMKSVQFWGDNYSQKTPNEFEKYAFIKGSSELLESLINNGTMHSDPEMNAWMMDKFIPFILKSDEFDKKLYGNEQKKTLIDRSILKNINYSSQASTKNIKTL